MNVTAINDGIKDSKERLELARQKLEDLKNEDALELLKEARDAIGEAIREFELADVPKVQEIIDIEKSIVEQEIRALHSAAVVEAEDALQSARARLEDEDFDGARREQANAKFYFAKAHKIFGSVQQEYLDKISQLELAIEMEVERASQVAAGDAALTAARSKLAYLDIEGAKEERATAVFAFQQAKADKRAELVWIHEQIVEAERQVIVTEGDTALAAARQRLKNSQIEAARAARIKAVEAFETSCEHEKMQTALNFEQDIAEVEIQELYATGGRYVDCARKKVEGGNDIEGAKEDRHLAAQVFNKAALSAEVLLRYQSAEIVKFLDTIAALTKQHAPNLGKCAKAIWVAGILCDDVSAHCFYRCI
jgi:hypothetical protein